MTDSLSAERAPIHTYGFNDFAKLLEAPVSIQDIVSQLTPPRHFANAEFKNYKPDPNFPSQQAAMESVLAWVQSPLQQNGILATLWRRMGSVTKEKVPLGVYLDGGFGIGKTHLLAAAYHAFNGKKAYLSFQELMFLVGLQTLAKTFETFSSYEIIFLDEFELDDPANTRIASNLVGKLMDRGVRILTTSNTPPGALGEHKFSVVDFARELHDLASRFQTIRIDGEDYRVTHLAAESRDGQGLNERTPEPTQRLVLKFSELLALLSSAHPIRVRNVLQNFGAIELQGAIPIDSPSAALRFVYCIDKAYDYDLRLKFDPPIIIREIFSPGVMGSGDAKKFRRAISRILEMTKNTSIRPI